MPDNGLTAREARERLATFGPNRIGSIEKVTFLGIAREEVTEPMILFLLVIGVIYSIWGKLGDAVTIFIVILILVFAEVFNEFRAKKAISALAKVTAPKARVVRDGRIAEIPSEDVVPDDILVLTTGTKIAADATVIASPGLQVNESALTGESYPKDKKTSDEVYAGTVVVSGEGKAVVRTTGPRTRLGLIAETAKTVKPPKTALQIAMRSLTGALFWLSLSVVALIMALGLLRGQDPKLTLLTGLSLAFATIPEELPIIITMVLGLGVYTLSKHNFLVKRIRAGEILGSVTVIVTDKTGTITEGKMELASVFPPDRARVLANARAALSEFSVSPLDRAIENGAGDAAMRPGPIVRKRGFGNGRRTRAVLRKGKEGLELFLNGAPEEVFAECRDVPAGAQEAVRQETSRGRRVIATAYRRIAGERPDAGFDALEKEMEFVGILSFEDPPRSGVKETIAAAKDAGIRTIMVTGDHPDTARFIARQVGIIGPDGAEMTGEELDGIDDERLRTVVREVAVFARTTPEHKYRIVKALQEDGEVVAVTGDGINDALALKSADIGIAMGIRGTDIAKEAAEVVLADDNYVTITRGIFEGRKFFDNLRKGVKYYLSVKIALVLTFLLPVIVGIAFPFSPIQIIVLEVFMDLAASAGFVAEPGEKNIYTRPPRKRSEGILDRGTIENIFLKGGLFFAGVSAVYFYAVFNGFSRAVSQTMAFSAWIIGHIVLAFVSRSDRETLAALGPFTNRVIDAWGVAAALFLILAMYVPIIAQRLFLAPLHPATLAAIAAGMLLLIGSLELGKRSRSVFS